MVLEGQRSAFIPAWGIAPGNGFQMRFSANGETHHPAGNMMERVFSPWGVLKNHSLGRCPRLG
jgi:hypothetical protein